jgi:hypothetical protein
MNIDIGYVLSIRGMCYRYGYLPCRYGHPGYRYGIWANDMGVTVSIWEMTVLVWDILSLWPCHLDLAAGDRRAPGPHTRVGFRVYILAFRVYGLVFRV